MKKQVLIFLLFVYTGFSQAQNKDKFENDSIRIHNIEIDFLYNYYQQEGENAAVTGGIGDQHLSNHAPLMQVNVPLDSFSNVSVIGGIDYYSSASTDKIDNVISSASSADARSHISIQYQKEPKKKRYAYGFGLGTSVEYDVVSSHIKGFFQQKNKNKNRTLNIKSRYYYDNWQMIYPIELRSSELPSTGHRQSLSFSFSLTQILTKRLQIMAVSDIAIQYGMLSTPFHRVYFEDQEMAILENLPDTRLRFPSSIRLHYYINDWLIGRGTYKYYLDNFGIQAHTYNIEFPIKITDYLRVYPFYRYYKQTASSYFVGYKKINSHQEFYTADSDLQEFSSQKFGLGIAYKPLYGISRWRVSKREVLMLKSIALRYAFYQKNIPFQAHSISFQASFFL